MRGIATGPLSHAADHARLTLLQSARTRHIDADQHEEPFDQAFAERFSAPVPDVFNADQQLTIVASELDPASERIVGYLSDRYAVPINAVFFRHFADGPSEYIARTWLLPPEKAESLSVPAARTKVRSWNGLDYYVILGTSQDEFRRWTIARKYRFLNAGGGSWYWKPLRNLTPAHRVFAYVGGAGYVGVGRVTGPMILLRDAEAQINGKTERVSTSPMWNRAYAKGPSLTTPEVTEYAVPV